jgi:hypothetical protein
MIRAAAVLLLAGAAVRAQTPELDLDGSLDDRAFRRGAREAWEDAYPVFCDISGVTPEEDSLYRIHVYASRDEYVAADRRLTEGRFANNGGFYCIETGEAHLVFAPRAEPAYLKEAPISERMRTLIVHEASHIFWRRHVPWQAGAPAWAQEGLAELCAQRARGKDALHGVTYSSGVHAVLRAAASGRLIPLEDILGVDGSTTPDSFRRDLFYRESWLLVRWLVEQRPEAWKKLVACFGEAARVTSPSARVRAAFEREVGRARDVQNAWLEWIAGLERGPWESKYGDWFLDGDVLEGAAFPRTGSAVFHQTEIRGDATISAELWVQDFAGVQADVLFGCWDDRGRNFVKIAFVADGLTAVLVLRDDKWDRLAFRQSARPPLKPGAWTPVSVALSGRTVTVTAAGREILSTEIDEPDVRFDGRWGFGNFDSRSRFRNWSVSTE